MTIRRNSTPSRASVPSAHPKPAPPKIITRDSIKSYLNKQARMAAIDPHEAFVGGMDENPDDPNRVTAFRELANFLDNEPDVQAIEVTPDSYRRVTGHPSRGVFEMVGVSRR